MKNIIIFVLDKSDDNSINNCIENVIIARDLYTYWKPYIFVPTNMNHRIKNKLLILECKIVEIDTNIPSEYWQFLAYDINNIEYFIIRDYNSRISPKCRNAVHQWLHKKKKFHILHDHISHTDLLISNMWGSKANLFSNIKHLLNKYLKNNKNPSVNNFFIKVMFEKIKDSYIAHGWNHIIKKKYRHI
jgi:hypothetical protein